MKIKFLGTRGSIPAPGKDTVKYGGNTTCVEFTTDENIKFIIDTGTGVRNFGNKYKIDSEGKIKIIYTHAHWDHLQGLPFFNPIYIPDMEINIYINSLHFESVKSAIVKQMSGESHPVEFKNLPAEIKFIPIDKKLEYSPNLSIELFENSHPGTASGIKFNNNGKILIFITDNEIKSLIKKGKYEELLQFCSNAYVIIHDGQYLEDDMKIKMGWGHSTIKDLAELFIAVKPKTGIFTHHDPERTDFQVEQMEESIRNEVKKSDENIEILAAREGDEIEFN